jgi:hypothetical protein
MLALGGVSSSRLLPVVPLMSAEPWDQGSGLVERYHDALVREKLPQLTVEGDSVLSAGST